MLIPSVILGLFSGGIQTVVIREYAEKKSKNIPEAKILINQIFFVFSVVLAVVSLFGVKISDEMKYVLDFQKELGITEKKVSTYCKKNGIPYKVVSDLNHFTSLNFIDKVDLGVYTGGGILGEAFLGKFSIGVFNCHGGKLPEMRGMNVSEWSVLLNLPLANTLHFMVRELDMGPIIEVIYHDYSSCKSIDQVRGLGIKYAILDLLYGVKIIISGNYSLYQQKKDQGKNYFSMHPIIKSIVNRKLVRDHV